MKKVQTTSQERQMSSLQVEGAVCTLQYVYTRCSMCTHSGSVCICGGGLSHIQTF